jgi:hypothetical protein
MTDITDMSDAALEVFLAIKGGDDCVVVDHLTADERQQVCRALGITARTHWVYAMPYAAPAAPRGAHGSLATEVQILDRQDDFYDE